MQELNEGNYKLKAFRISAIAIFSVVVVEVTIGIIVNSLAIISDGLHALLDVVSSVLLFFAVRASLKPPDKEHTYGHEKFETLGGLIGGIVLIFVAALILYEASLRFLENSQLALGIEYAGFFGIGYALFIACLRTTLFRKSTQERSLTMKAGFYDAISDLSSTIIALIGFSLATIGFNKGDAFASIFLGVLLIFFSTKLVKSSIMELSDTASKELFEKTKKIILSCEGVVETDNFKVRKVSSKIFIDASVHVSNLLSFEEAHSLASKIESCLKDAFGNVDATIHVEPSNKEGNMDQLVKKIATIDGVKEVHEVSSVFIGGKLYITLHAFVSPEMSVEDAHKIAEGIEHKMHAEIKALENVTVHVEPAGGIAPAAEINEAELKKIVYKTAKGIAANLHIKRVLTYFAKGKRYVIIDCCFTKQVQIKEAHRIASQIEKETKEHFTNAVVTVHIEPD